VAAAKKEAAKAAAEAKRAEARAARDAQEREQAAIRLAGMGTHALKGDRGYQEDRVTALTLRGGERFVRPLRGRGPL
jgi:hypothetical protein